MLVTESDLEAARAVIQAGNVEWGRARVAIDRSAFDRMLAPDFHVVIRGQRLTRTQFMDRISSYPAGVTLTRFDARVLTVQPEDDGWIALILEKLEFQRRGEDGAVATEYVFAVTRDGWRREGGRWFVRFSHLLGDERWSGGRRPPLPDW